MKEKLKYRLKLMDLVKYKILKSGIPIIRTKREMFIKINCILVDYTGTHKIQIKESLVVI